MLVLKFDLNVFAIQRATVPEQGIMSSRQEEKDMEAQRVIINRKLMLHQYKLFLSIHKRLLVKSVSSNARGCCEYSSIVD